ncbi:TonB family protein [Caulobacter sp. SLTY]|uniref:energy transducer TonB n=1 Tax=Caulobacter sp. SLTY TaxID=2683262 RepID=UPI00141354CD|nr:energy transducer TonB [Caulobacter sp. SLTY]NBB15290.1 TonB family protein [Caulobacter sp. SLTY]
MFSLLFALLMAPAAAPAPDFGKPEWTARPTADQMIDAYPTKALERALAGRVVIECRASSTGALDGCKVVSESPANAGFAKPTLELAKLYQMKPIGPDGLPVTGRVVRIPVVWTPPGRFLADNGPYDLAPRDKLRWQGRVRPSKAVGDVETMTLICRITETGRLSPCAEPGKRRAYDGPAKWTLRQFQAEPLDADGKPTRGRLVVLDFPKAASKLP